MLGLKGIACWWDRPQAPPRVPCGRVLSGTSSQCYDGQVPKLSLLTYKWHLWQVRTRSAARGTRDKGGRKVPQILFDKPIFKICLYINWGEGREKREHAGVWASLRTRGGQRLTLRVNSLLSACEAGRSVSCFSCSAYSRPSSPQALKIPVSATHVIGGRSCRHLQPHLGLCHIWSLQIKFGGLASDFTC